LEAIFLQADLGVKTTLELLAKLQAVSGFSATAAQVEREAREELTKLLPPPLPPLLPLPGRPRVMLVVGVNGTGKTTSLAKLAALLKREGRSVMMAAGDTFRAAAIEQLVAWGDRLGIPVIRGAYQGDPAALCHDAYEAAQRSQVEFLLVDTAGRLHTKHNLMQELSKVKRVLGRQDPESPHEILIVLDATTGSNALEQAKSDAGEGKTPIVWHRRNGKASVVIVDVVDLVALANAIVDARRKAIDAETIENDAAGKA
jgi:fused signal recognition particle receptor